MFLCDVFFLYKQENMNPTLAMHNALQVKSTPPFAFLHLPSSIHL